MMKFTVYWGRDRLWYWRATARNGRIVADSGEGYSSHSNAMRAVGRFVGSISDGKYDWPPASEP